MIRMRTLSFLVFSLALAAPLAAQDAAPSPTGPEVVDRVVAVVGDTVLLLSDIQTELQQLEASGRLPADPVQREAAAREIVEARVNDLLLLEAAQEAGLTVSPEEVNETVEQNLRAVRRQFRSEQEFASALQASGRSLEQYREELAAQQRSQLLIQQFVAQRLRSRARPLISEEQIRRAFDAQRASLGTRPATISLQQVVVEPQPTDSARAAARAEAEDVLRQLREGGDFEVLARRFSDDPGSKEHGGDLGWFKRGRMVPEFENVAFALRPGDVSPIVDTEFGYHIIKVEKSRGAERQARHILIRPEVTEADIARARERADSVAQAIRSGASVTVLARQYDTPESEIEITSIPVDRLPPGHFEAVRGQEAGAVVGPVEVQQGPAGAQFAVLKVIERREAGEYTLDDVREQLRGRLQEREMVEQLVQELRNEIHVAMNR